LLSKGQVPEEELDFGRAAGEWSRSEAKRVQGETARVPLPLFEQ
jgi:hypothetical protein